MNFIDIEDLAVSMENLNKAPKIRELYLTGNPCETWEGFKDFVIASVPQLYILNGNEILKSERIKASQNYENLKKELEKASIENIIKKENDPDKDNPNRYTKEYRRTMYKELEEERLKKEEDKKKSNKPWGYEDLPKDPPSVYKDNGEIRICNQGKYEFLLDEDILNTATMTFELKLPKYMDTANLKVDLNPQYIRVDVKGKITQLKLDHEIIIEKSTIQRSTTTGHLVIKAPIVGYKPKPNTTKSDTIINPKSILEENKNKNDQNRKKFLKPLEESLELKKRGNIELVDKVESELIKPAEVKKETYEIDVDLDEIPDLD